MSQPGELPEPARRIINAMRAWYQNDPRFPGMRAESVRGRTDQQMLWDHAIFTASEYVRRRTGNEVMSVEMLGLLSTLLPPEEEVRS